MNFGIYLCGSSRFFIKRQYLILIVTLLSNSIFAQDYKLSGELIEVRSKDKKTNIVDFELFVHGYQWLFKFNTNIYYPQFLSTQIGFDGTNLYSLNYLERHHFEPGGSAADFILANGSVKALTEPSFDYYRTPQLWLVYCSRFYAGLKTGQLPCPLIYPAIGANCLLEAQINTDIEDTNLITSVVTMASGTASLSNGQEVPLPEPFQNGYKNGSLSVLSFTNYQGIKVPIEFTFNTYYMAENAKTSNDVALVYSLYGKVKDIGSISQDFLPPKITTKTFVQDYRVPPDSKVEYVRYFTTNKWLNPSEPRFKVSVRNEIELNKPRKVTSNLARYVVLITFLILPVIFVGVYKIRQKNES